MQDDPEQVGRWVAEYIRQRINKFGPTADKPFVLGKALYTTRWGHMCNFTHRSISLAWFDSGLPTGSSPLATYKVSWKV